MGFDINKLIMESVSETLNTQQEEKVVVQEQNNEEQSSIYMDRVASGLAAGSGALELVKTLRARRG